MARQAAIKWADRVFELRSILKNGSSLQPVHTTSLGALFSNDCMDFLPHIKDASVDTVFADPPFNLGKQYGDKCNDLKSADEYLKWCKAWMAECVRGAFFLYNLPKWNVLLGAYLTEIGMDFRHWIAVEISACLPISGRLHPSHYSLLYYTKGKPKTFEDARLAGY